MPVSIRASFVPQITACSASAVPPKVRIETSGEPARIGNAVHEGQAAFALCGEELDPVALAQKHRVDADELRYLLYAGRKWWRMIEGHFPSPQCEEELSWNDEISGICLTGHPDVDSVGDHMAVADWKSGFLWSDAEPQLRSYSRLLFEQHPEAKTITAFHVNLRRDEIERFDWSREELVSWWDAMAARIKNGREVYSPGYEACKYCPRWRECQAGQEMASQAIRAMALEDDSPFDVNDVAVVTFARAKFLAKLADDVIGNVRTMVAQNGGRLESSDGRALVFERQKRDKVNAKFGYLEMSRSLPIGDILDACTVSKTKLLDAARATAPRGKKKEAADDLMDRLRGAGAVSETFIEKLELRSAPKGLPKMIEQGI